MKNNKTFPQRHPKIKKLLELFLLLLVPSIGLCLLLIVLNYVKTFVLWLVSALSKVDAVIVVALITGSVSILGVVISSVIGKRIEYKKSRNEYLAQKREKPYGDFVEMVYKLQKNIKSPNSYSQKEMISDMSNFSRELTLWGSPKVAKKWNEFRVNGANPDKATENIFVLEEIMNEMRKDIGTKRIKKGGLLSFFVNDIDKVK